MAEQTQETEVLATAKRRTFTADYKRRILDEAAACEKRGELGALLRREGLYSSHLVEWRAARERGERAALEPKKRGPAPSVPDARDRRIADLERQNKQLAARAERAELLVEIQKKVSMILGIELPKTDGER